MFTAAGSAHRSSRPRARRVAFLGCVSLAFVLMSGAGASASGGQDEKNDEPDTVTFAFIGDVPYTSTQTPLLHALTASINADPDVEFVGHSGDFKGGSDSCSDAAFETTFQGFQALNDPFWYTPGDNDWTDCHRNSNGNFQPADRLAKVRSLYFSDPKRTTGGTQMKVKSQAKSRVKADRVLVENTMFDRECVTFGAIHSVSSNQGYLDPKYTSTSGSGSSGYPVETAAEKAARYAEVDARIVGDVRWIDQIFSAARKNESGAVFLMMQAEPKIGPIDNDSVYGTEFVAIRNEIFAMADANPNMQVVIAHGDQHIHLWEPGYGGADHPNVARLENWGSSTGGVLAVTRWEKVTATCGEDGTPAVFTVVDQTV